MSNASSTERIFIAASYQTGFTGCNDKIVALVGQLCTNPKSDRSLLQGETIKFSS